MHPAHQTRLLDQGEASGEADAVASGGVGQSEQPPVLSDIMFLDLLEVVMSMYSGVWPRAHVDGSCPILPDWLVAGRTRQTLS
jgi:hypothetical protein